MWQETIVREENQLKLKNNAANIKFIEDTYGSGTLLSLPISIIILICTTSLSAYLYFCVDVGAINNDLPMWLNAIFLYYFQILVFCIGLLFFSLFFYCKPRPEKDYLKGFKIFFVFSMLLVFSVLLLPFMIITNVFNGVGKLFKINKLTMDFVKSLLVMALWLISFIFCLYISTFLIQIAIIFINLASIHELINGIAILYYGMFFSIFISNKIAKISYLKFAKISDDEDVKKASQQMSLLWCYTILFISFAAKPLNFNNEVAKAFFDALFYSSATITLLSKIVEMRAKQT
jgi:hypothetical protein